MKIALKTIFLSNAYLSYIDSPRPQTWEWFFISFRDFYLDDATKPISQKDHDFQESLQDLANVLLDELCDIYGETESKDITNQLDKAKAILALIIKTDDIFKTDKIMLKAGDKSIDKSKRKHFDLAFWSFMESVVSVSDFFASLKVSHPNITNSDFEEFKNQIDLVLFTSYQEFYHAFSHLCISCNYDINSMLERASGHLLRGALDIVKVAVNAKKYALQDNKFGLDCRIAELDAIGDHAKQKVFTGYLKLLNQ